MTATTSGASRFLRRAVVLHVVAAIAFVGVSVVFLGASSPGDVARAVLFAGLALLGLGVLFASVRGTVFSPHDAALRAHVDWQIARDPDDYAWRQQITLLLWCAGALLAVEAAFAWLVWGAVS